MRILPTDQAVLDHVAARRQAIIGRTIDWADINSGSRNAAGLNAVLDALEAEAPEAAPAIAELRGYISEYRLDAFLAALPEEEA